MSITAAAGAAFEATVSNTSTGLVGTIGVQIVDGQGDVTLARTTSGIVESPAASGVYTATLIAPSTPGSYVVTWDTGGVSPVYAVEDLIVTSGSVGGTEPFITVTDLTDYLGRGDVADPAMIIAVDAACDICRTIAEQPFNADVTTVVLDGTGTDALLLPKLPVTAVDSVVVAGSIVTDYVLNDNGILFRKASTDDVDYTDAVQTLTWPVGRQNIAVTYYYGYADDDVPRDVRMVALSIAARLAVQGPAIQESIGNVSVRYGVNATDLTNGEKAILAKYRQTR